MSNFHEGQKVVCISDNFPMFRTTNEDKRDIGKQSILHPKKGDTLIIDEMLGDFLRFDKYDCNNPTDPNYGYNWWHNSRFRPIDEIEITFSSKEKSLKEIRQ